MTQWAKVCHVMHKNKSAYKDACLKSQHRGVRQEDPGAGWPAHLVESVSTLCPNKVESDRKSDPEVTFDLHTSRPLALEVRGNF